jgi:D-3-phosphoglycerate dehydrogenase
VYGYDPFLSVDSALMLSRAVHRVLDLSSIYKTCDYITLHLPLADSTRGTLNAKAFEQMKTGIRIINLARGELVNDDDMIAALDSGKVACYVTDFPNNKIALMKNVVPIPHLGASSPESEDNCAIMAAKQLRDYLENGNISNSVNLPTLKQDCSGVARLCIIHRNIPNMLASVTSLLSRDGVNVENMTNKSKGEYAYTVVDINTDIGEDTCDKIRAISGILRVRLIKM